MTKENRRDHHPREVFSVVRGRESVWPVREMVAARTPVSCPCRTRRRKGEEVTTTLITALAILCSVLAVMLAWHKLEERSRRRDREIVRRIHTYLAQLPPSRPW
jgi:hypothetical protein